MIALITYASFGAPGIGGTFYVVVSDGSTDYQHKVSFTWRYGSQKESARQAAEKLLARVREARVSVEHCAKRPEFWQEAAGIQAQPDDSWIRCRVWAHQVERAFAAGEAHS